MTSKSIKSLVSTLSTGERQMLIGQLQKIQPAAGVGDQPLGSVNSEATALTTQENKIALLQLLDFPELSKLISGALKQQSITYEEMAIQIGVSLSTFKRMIIAPENAKAINLHSLLKELGIKLWLGK